MTHIHVLSILFSSVLVGKIFVWQRCLLIWDIISAVQFQSVSKIKTWFDQKYTKTVYIYMYQWVSARKRKHKCIKQWSYVFLAVTHWYVLCIKSKLNANGWLILEMPQMCKIRRSFTPFMCWWFLIHKVLQYFAMSQQPSTDWPEKSYWSSTADCLWC